MYVGLCCITTPIWQFPGLKIPIKMQQMNYGCGSIDNPRDLVNEPFVLCVGVGGGMELLQLAYISRNRGTGIGVDLVNEMLFAHKQNLEMAEKENSWFKYDFIIQIKGMH